jgi:hypothetical protein
MKKNPFKFIILQQVDIQSQVDLIDLSSHEVKGVKWILHYMACFSGLFCMERGNDPFKDSLSRLMQENANEYWTMGAYIVSSRNNEHAIDTRGNQSPSELMFGERPICSDALEKVSSLIRTEQGLLAVIELLEYFRTKHGMS